MKLLIDIGNTRLKLATLHDDHVQFVTAIKTACTEQLQKDLKAAIQDFGAQAQDCIAVSVGSAQTNQAVQNTLSPVAVQWVKPATEAAGIKNAYPDPSQLGADRWVSMIGLTKHFDQPHPPIVLASFGTATTVDTLSPDNEFKGGLILPGVSMMHEALAIGTARLPNASGLLAPFPTDTISAISSGVMAAQVGAVLRQTNIAHSVYGCQPIVCVTGGAHQAVVEELRSALRTAPIQELPNIVLDGLAVLANLA